MKQDKAAPSFMKHRSVPITGVARYLIDEGGLAPELVTVAGHADTQPVAGNDLEERRTKTAGSKSRCIQKT